VGLPASPKATPDKSSLRDYAPPYAMSGLLTSVRQARKQVGLRPSLPEAGGAASLRDCAPAYRSGASTGAA